MKRFTPLKLFTLASTRGFTLIELIVGGAVSLVVLSVTLGLVVEQRRLFLGDQSRIDSNQNLRAASDFIGTDIKQVGERVESDAELPVIRLISGSGSNPDTLILQRKLIEDKLYLCNDIALGDSEITVADSSTTCSFDDGDGDKLTDSLGQFKTYRCDLENVSSCTRGNDDSVSEAKNLVSECDDECIYAFIYDPTQNAGEFVLYTDEIYQESSGETTNKLKVIPLNSGQFERTYTAGNPIIYILEEKKYAVCDGVLQLTTNRQPDYSSDCPYPNVSPQPVRLVDGIENFQARVQHDGSWKDLFNNNLSSLSDFNEVDSIEINLTTEINNSNNSSELTSKFFPRNVKSDF